MKRTKELNTNKGITLIALVITIIVMLILVGVTISMSVNGGLFEKAGEAVGKTNNALKEEQTLADGGVKVGDTWYNSIDEYLVASGNKAISKDKSYIGCYADVDGDGDADGVIYADLAIGTLGEDGEVEKRTYLWGYSYGQETDLKDYKVSGTADGDFGDGIEVITAAGTGGTKDRFYVMALEDYTTEGDYYYWYDDAFEWYSTANTDLVLDDAFGTGKANTGAMITGWNSSTYGTQNTGKFKDVWGAIQSKATSGWFVPSPAEWDAFADEFNLTSEFNDDGTWGYPLGLSQNYWTSYTIHYGPFIFFGFGSFEPGDYTPGASVRLSITF